MISALFWAIFATLIVSLLSLVGIFSLWIKSKAIDKLLFLLVGFSAGALMGSAFLHLIPESLEGASYSFVGLSILMGFSLFFIIERGLHWHHCHKKGKCDVHMFAYMNIVGDAVHNFIDGLVIAASFVINVNLGVVTTIAIIMHEIPQELGDFAVMVYGGLKKAKALMYNFLTALTAVLGAIVGYFLSSFAENVAMFLVPFAAGGFIYIAASDLIPELHKEPKLKKSMYAFLFFLIGVIFMYLIKMVLG